MSTQVHRCARHAGARAGWFCPSCAATLCPGCVFARTASVGVELVCCSRCGAMVEPLTAPRSALRSFSARLPAALAATFTAGSLITLLGTALVMWLLGHLGLPGAVLRLGVFWGFLFTALRRASRGEPGLEPPDLSDVWHDLLRPALLGLVASLLVIVPLAAWVFQRPGGLAASYLEDPVLWVLAIAAALYAPMAVMQAAMGATVGQMLNPLGVVGAAVRLRGDYVLAVGACVLLVIGDLALSAAAGGLLGGIPVVSGVVRELVGLVGPALLARTLGLLLHVRGDDVHLGMPQDYAEPVLPGAVPRGSPPAAAPTPAAPAPAAPRSGPAGRFEALELDPPAAPGDPAAQIAERTRAGDLAGAARLYATLRPPALSAPVLFQVARGAAGAGEHALAAQALQAAARTLDPAVAPDALLVLARICLQRLDRPADARAALDALLARFPETPAAQHGRALRAQVPD